MPTLPVQCPSGSRQITPFMPTLVHNYQSPKELAGLGTWPPVGSTANYLERWQDPDVGYRSYANTDRLRTWRCVEPAPTGTQIRPMHGHWDSVLFPGPPYSVFGSSTRHNTWAWEFLERFHATHNDFHNDSEFWNGGNRNTSSTGSGGGRAYIWRPLFWAINNTGGNGSTAYQWMIDWCKAALIYRTYHHVWRGTTGGSPAYDAGLSAPVHPCYHRQGDDQANHNPNGSTNERSWTASTAWSDNDTAWTGTKDEATYGSWRSWDRGHNYHLPWSSLAIYGHPLGAIDVWNNWRWVSQNFPGSLLGAHHQSQPREACHILMIIINAWLAGIEYADPTMFVTQCGGIYGRNGGNGWRPSSLLPQNVASVIGARFNGGIDFTDKTGPWLDSAVKCDRAGMMGCVPGHSTGGDGHYASEHGWQAGMLLWAMIYFREFRNWMLTYYGVNVLTGAPVTGSNPTGDPDVLFGGFQDCLAHSIDYVKYHALFTGDEGLFTLGEWAELFAEEQLVSPPTSILPVAGRGFTTAFAQTLYDASTDPPSNKDQQQVHALATAGRANVVERGQSGTPQWMNPAAYAWFYGTNDGDVVNMTEHPRFPTFGSAGYTGEKVNLAGPYYGAEENSSTVVPADAEMAIEVPQLTVENTGLDIILPQTPECALQIDNPTFQLENEIEVGLDTVELWATTSITSDTSIDFSLVLTTPEVSLETDDPTLIIDPPGPGEDIEIILSAAEVALEIDDPLRDFSGPIKEADVAIECDDVDIEGEHYFSTNTDFRFPGKLHVRHKLVGRFK